MTLETIQTPKMARVSEMETNKATIEKKSEDMYTSMDKQACTMKEYKRFDGMVYALHTIQAWIELEKRFENPREELGITKYTQQVDRLRVKYKS